MEKIVKIKKTISLRPQVIEMIDKIRENENRNCSNMIEIMVEYYKTKLY